MHHHNGLKTAVLLGGLSAVILLAGGAFGGTSGLLIALVIAFGISGFSYWKSDTLALRSMRAQPVTEQQAPELYAIVRELTTRMQIPMPTIHISPTDAPNAFATGRSPEHAAVCCTAGILEILDQRELRAVLGHELAHVNNRDILISSVAGALATAIMFLAQLAQFGAIFGGGGRDNGERGEALAVALLGPVVAGLLQMALSRSREFQADQSGAEITSDPLGLASALRKLEAGTAARPLANDPRLTPAAAVMIANPFRGGGMSKLFSTHPPMAERIARLEQLSGQYR